MPGFLEFLGKFNKLPGPIRSTCQFFQVASRLLPFSVGEEHFDSFKAKCCVVRGQLQGAGDVPREQTPRQVMAKADRLAIRRIQAPVRGLGGGGVGFGLRGVGGSVDHGTSGQGRGILAKRWCRRAGCKLAQIRFRRS